MKGKQEAEREMGQQRAVLVQEGFININVAKEPVNRRQRWGWDNIRNHQRSEKAGDVFCNTHESLGLASEEGYLLH